MCGIAAIFHYKQGAVDRSELLRIRDHMQSRGPDGAGEWISPDGRLGLAHRRLSIIDLSEGGSQPMPHASGRYQIVFNGEIYNYRHLRSHLEVEGAQFRSSSDTEVLLHLYERKGAMMLRQLRGMYAFAIWDQLEGSLFLARDPFGIKPLYFADDGKTCRLASQVKALLAGGRVSRSSDPAGEVGFFLWGHVPEPFTTYSEVKVVPPGHSIRITANGVEEPKSFTSVSGILRESESRATEPLNLQEAVRDTVAHHLIADVPVGIFQSAGIDSSTLTGVAAGLGGDLDTVTLGFEEFKNRPEDETILAEQVAKAYRTRHSTVWISRADFDKHAERLLQAMDLPTTDGVNTYFVSMAARQSGLKVALSGLGGDEIFGGYESFHDIPKAVSRLRHIGNVPGLGKGFRVISSGLLKHFTSPKYAGLLEYGGSYPGAYLLRRGMFMPWEIADLLGRDRFSAGWEKLNTISELSRTIEGIQSPRARISALELNWYMRNQLLRDADWASMAHSLEVRVPFVDVEFLSRVAPACSSPLNAPGKGDLGRSVATPLPGPLINRPKTGFFIPVRSWIMKSCGVDQATRENRGLRGWAKYIYQQFSSN
jgi:asparagine synthase (glutamine-hydrolysing)